MATIFTRIIEGDLPGRFVWRDERSVAFLSINPMQPGHTLVVPIEEIDHWLDLDPELVGHLNQVAQTIGQAQMLAFSPQRIGLMIAGLEAPHTHLHLIPMNAVHDLDFANAEAQPDPTGLDAAAAAIRTALGEMGATGVVES